MTLDLLSLTTPDEDVPENLRRLEPGGFWIRAAARAVDWLVRAGIGAVAGLLFGVVAGIIQAATGRSAMDFVEAVQKTTFISWIGNILATVAYHALFEGVSGTTIGKRLIGLQVISLDGSPVRFGQGVKRSVAFLVDALFFGAIAWGEMKDSPERQRIGDRWAGTRVVRRRSLDAGALPSRLLVFAAFVAAAEVAFLLTLLTLAAECLWHLS